MDERNRNPKLALAYVLYKAGRDPANEHYASIIAEALVRIGNAGQLYQAGKDWPDDHYTPIIADALIQTGNAEFLAKAGTHW
jgi:hypothetical protein